jgi:hypothetical protein
VAAALGERFVRVASVSLGALHLTVHAHRALRPVIGGVQVDAVASGGPGAALGTKGGVAVALLVGKTSLLVVNSHLAAHAHAVERRAEDYARIERGLRLLPRPARPGERVADRVSDRFDRVVWVGDLNYRLDAPRAAVDAALARATPEPLWRADQLARERAAGRVFAGFTEGPLLFKPTYKFDTDAGAEDRYDSSPKARVPSWTDRVLFRPPGAAMVLLSYDALVELRGSDHRAVHASLLVRLRRHADTELDPLRHVSGAHAGVAPLSPPVTPEASPVTPDASSPVTPTEATAAEGRGVGASATPASGAATPASHATGTGGADGAKAVEPVATSTGAGPGAGAVADSSAPAPALAPSAELHPDPHFSEAPAALTIVPPTLVPVEVGTSSSQVCVAM